MSDLNEDPGAPAGDTTADALHWAIVEIMGHRRHAGMVHEVERFGAKFIRIDVYGAEGPAYDSRDYSGAAIFSLTPTDEATARRIGEYDKPKPRPILALPLPDLELDADAFTGGAAEEEEEPV